MEKQLFLSAHAISEGGLFTTLPECAMVKQLGFSIETDHNFRKDAYLFGESQSRILITIASVREDELIQLLNSNNVPFTRLEEVTGSKVITDDDHFGEVSEWKDIYDYTLEQKLENQ